MSVPLDETSLLPIAQPHMRVLVVDDDESICTLAMETLGAEGYLVLEARDGATALSLIRAGKADAVVLDLGLPEMSGFDVLAAARAFTDIPHTGVTPRGRRLHGQAVLAA